MQIQPQTIENELILQVNELTGTSPYYIEPSNPDWLELVHKAEKLRTAERWAGWSVLGILYGTIGDVAGMNRAFETSLTWKHDPTTVHNWIGNLGNVGCFSAAHDLFAKEAEPTKGLFSYLAELGEMLFAFQRTHEYLNIAKEMNMRPEAVNTEFISSIATILADAGLSDADVAQHLDIAGDILRKRRIRVNTTTEALKLPGIQNGMTIAVNVPVSQSEAFDMNIELAQAEEERAIKKHPAFDIVFAAV